jgi:hypothetical protein
MNCSEETRAFLVSKATNFRAFLLEHKPDVELANSIAGFEPGALMTTLLTVFLPTVSLKGLESVATELSSHLDLTDADAAAVRDKVSRYLACFYEVLTEKE